MNTYMPKATFLVYYTWFKSLNINNQEEVYK